MFRSASFKLTSYYLLILAVISFCFSCALYRIGTNDLAFGLGRQTARIRNDFPVFSDSPYLRAGSELREGNHRLIAQLIVFNAFVLVGGGFASYALARRTLEPIAAAHDRQKRFTADVSHELRTPLTALKMEAEVALLDPQASKTELRQVLTSTVEEAAKLDDLVTNLLRLSQLDASGRAALLSDTLLSDVLQPAVAQLRPVAEARGITIECSAMPNVKILAEAQTLTQLFVILLDNAIKYSSDNSLVSVGVAHDRKKVLVTITDQGAGIAKDDLEHVFERFYRADSARSKGSQTGFGLGLSIAQLIADNHQATITLTSQLGRGTTATVALPEAVQSSQH